MRPPSHRHRLARGALLLIAVLLPWQTARADSLAARFEPSYDSVDTTLTDPSGAKSYQSANALTQRYFLSLDKTIFSNLRFAGTGNYQWALTSSSATGTPPTESDNRLWNADARLTAGDPLLNAVASYTVGERSSRSMSDGILSTTPTLFHDTAALSGVWRPEGLPQLQLLLSRDNQRDLDRQIADLSTTQAVLQAVYRPDPRVDTRARILWSNPVDHLHGIESTTFGEEARASYGEDFLDRRLTIYASYIFNATQLSAHGSGSGGTVAVPQYPIRGLSIVEGPTALPTNVKLTDNAALIDGDLTTSAGINIGFGPSAKTDTANRDMGAQFTNIDAPVNLVYVWVDRPLPPAIAGAFTWTVYQSEDGQIWTEIPKTDKVTFGLFQNRFEIPIQSTRPRFIKAVTRPLPVGVTLDQQYEVTLVTEIQLVNALPSSEVGRELTTITGFFNETTRYQIIPNVLWYDFSLSLNHASNPTRLMWGVTNGVSFAKQLNPVLVLSARADRSDAKDPRGSMTAATRWSASLDASPLPTLGGSFTYSGDWTESAGETTRNNGFSLFGRATPYRNVSLFASLAYSIGTRDGRTQRSESASVGTSITPNPKLALSGNFSYSRSSGSIVGQPGGSSEIWRADGNATFSPVPALYATASVSHGLIASRHQTLIGFSGNLSPFPGGSLIASFRYNQTIDTLTDSKTLTWGPYVRWNITGRSFVEVNYTLLDVSTPAQDASSRAFGVRLTVPL